MGEIVTTADWRGAIGYLRCHDHVTLICELASARALDVLRAVMRDDELRNVKVIGVAMDPETVEVARKMGLADIVADGDFDSLRRVISVSPALPDTVRS